MYWKFHSLIKTSMFFIQVILESPQWLASMQILSSMRWGSPATGIFFYNNYSHSVNITNSIQISHSRQFTTMKRNSCLFVCGFFFKDFFYKSYNQPSDSSNVCGSCSQVRHPGWYNSASILFGCLMLFSTSAVLLCFCHSGMTLQIPHFIGGESEVQKAKLSGLPKAMISW